MQEYPNLYINGKWVPALSGQTAQIVNPATEAVCARVASGGADDVNLAIAAAKKAFGEYSQTSVSFRKDLLNKIVDGINRRSEDFAVAISQEMGAPLWWARLAQVPSGAAHFRTAAKVLDSFEFELEQGSTLIRREAIGVCGMITPWNWPLNQVSCKVAAALAVGCTIVLKPAEQTSLDSILLAEVMDEAGVPPGVFNLVNGPGSVVGAILSEHPDIDMVSFTGSTYAGVQVAKSAADSVKRVSQELGGKSAQIILPSADLGRSVRQAVHGFMTNAGQTCSAGSRLLVPADRHDEAAEVAKQAADAIPLASSEDALAPSIGPISTKKQFDQISEYITIGVDEGATLVAGGASRPPELNRGYFLRPTILANVSNDMRVAQEEIFGPVLCIIPFETVREAIAIANDSRFGLSGYVFGDHEEAIEVAKQIHTGQVFINGAGPDYNAPFGGFKQSGNGREWGEIGFDEFLEYKSILGARVASAAE